MPTGTQYGDTHALLQWVLDNEDACDVLIVSMDQLLSGGLVNSRWEDGTDLTWEKDAIDTLSQIAARKPVYVFDTVMRLATTARLSGTRQRGLPPVPQLRHGRARRADRSQPDGR